MAKRLVRIATPEEVKRFSGRDRRPDLGRIYSFRKIKQDLEGTKAELQNEGFSLDPLGHYLIHYATFYRHGSFKSIDYITRIIFEHGYILGDTKDSKKKAIEELYSMANRYLSRYIKDFVALTSPIRYSMVAKAFEDLDCRVERIMPN